MGAQPLDHFNDDVIEPDAQGAIGQHLHRDMTIAHMPGDAGSLHQVVAAKIGNGFFGRDDPHKPAAFEEQTVAIGHARGLIQIELDHLIVIGAQPDTPAMPVLVVQRDAGGFLIGRPIARAQDACRTPQHQKRKYRWAMDSSSAGSQVISSPSARTS